MKSIITSKIVNLLLLCVLFLCWNNTQAHHIAGADIEYVNSGVRKWKIKLNIYAFCDNASMDSTKTVTVQPSLSLAQGGLNLSSCESVSNIPVVLTLTGTVKDIEQFRVDRCGAAGKNTCSNMGNTLPGTFEFGAEQYIYEGTLDMSDSAFDEVCNYWDIVLQEEARTNLLTNVFSKTYAVKSTLDIYHAQDEGMLFNNSPVFTYTPVINLYSSVVNKISLGGVDPDGDFLTYKIVKSLDGANTPSEYHMGYDETIPFWLNKNLPPHNARTGNATVVMDSITGDFSMNPTNSSDTEIKGDLTIEITQWTLIEVGGQMIPKIVGKTMRNMVLINRNRGELNMPYITTQPSNNDGSAKVNWEVKPGEALCFTITAQSDGTIDSTFIEWNNSLNKPGKITFEPDYDLNNPAERPLKDKWKFCWQTESEDVSELPYVFTILSTNNNCPAVGYNYQSFSIRVTNNPSSGLIKVGQDVKMTITPNPTNGEFTMDFKAPVGDNVIIKLYNIAGVEVFSEDAQVMPGTNSLPFTKEIKPGIYILKMQGREINSTSKIIFN